MATNEQTTSMITWTCAAVMAAGAAVVLSVMSPPASIEQLRKQSIVQTNLVQAADRSPASAEPEYSALTLDDHGTQAVDLTVPCEGRSRFAKNIVQVRLKGSLCALQGRQGRHDQREIVSSEILNVTNGFSATVFYPKLNSFTTDYMTLAPGENRINISHLLKVGSRIEREFVIDRQ